MSGPSARSRTYYDRTFERLKTYYAPKVITCRRCGATARSGRLKLCKSCYRAHRHEYRSEVPVGLARAPDYHPRGPAPAPCPCLPGTPGKVEALCVRLACGWELWHPEDAGCFPEDHAAREKFYRPEVLPRREQDQKPWADFVVPVFALSGRSEERPRET